jgi:hypothetical protein
MKKFLHALVALLLSVFSSNTRNQHHYATEKLNLNHREILGALTLCESSAACTSSEKVLKELLDPRIFRSERRGKRVSRLDTGSSQQSVGAERVEPHPVDMRGDADGLDGISMPSTWRVRNEQGSYPVPASLLIWHNCMAATERRLKP